LRVRCGRLARVDGKTQQGIEQHRPWRAGEDAGRSGEQHTHALTPVPDDERPHDGDDHQLFHPAIREEEEADGPEQHIKQADVSSGEASPDLADVSLPTCSPLHEARALAAASSE